MEYDSTTTMSDCPLKYMDDIFKENVEEFSTNSGKLLSKIKETFSKDVVKSWPSVNSSHSSSLGPVLVKSRCMVQDSLGSEFFASSCELTRNDKTAIECGLLRDSFGNDAVVTRTISHEARHCYVMVPIPGATSWYERLFNVDEEHSAESDAKKARLEGKGLEKDPVRTFVAKFMDESADQMKVNTVVDVYGVLHRYSEGEGKENEDDGMDERTETNTNVDGLANLHVIHYEEVALFPPDLSLPSSPSSSLSCVRSLLFDCLGDELAADYLTMHLISTTWSRMGDTPICALPLNICGVKDSNELLHIVETLMPKVKFLPFSCESLSSPLFHSVKNHETGRLQQGLFQLADGTCLVIDETNTPNKMEVREHAEVNLQTLHRIISEQKMEYDFGVYRLSFDVDISILVLSQERSRFVATPFRVCVPHSPSPSSSPLSSITSHQLTQLRTALMHTKHSLREVIVSGEVAKTIQEDFATMCAEGDNGMNAETKATRLGQLLIVARLVTAMSGEKEMSVELWKKAVDMERKRLAQVNNRFPEVVNK